jgi:hypothetical protein
MAIWLRGRAPAWGWVAVVALWLAAVTSLTSACKSKGEVAKPVSSWTQPFLYRIESPADGGAPAKPSFVFGTIHVSDPRLQTFPPPLRSALDSVDELYTEIAFDAGVQMHLVSLAQLPSGKTLSSELPPALYRRTQMAYLSHGLPLKPFDHMRPSFVAMQVSLLAHLKQLENPIDARLYKDAQSRGKVAGGLETPEEQMSIFTSLTAKEEEEMLSGALDAVDKAKKDKRDPIGELLDVYVEGSEDALLKALAAEMKNETELDKKISKRLLADRNVTMTDRMIERMAAKPQRSFFFAVGSAHVIGPGGIVDRLRQGGYQVTRVH